jgi:hypothetical protein
MPAQSFLAYLKLRQEQMVGNQPQSSKQDGRASFRLCLLGGPNIELPPAVLLQRQCTPWYSFILKWPSMSLLQRFQTVGHPPGGPVRPLGGGGEVIVRGTCLFLMKYGRKVKYILTGTLLGWNILLITQYRYWFRTISSTFCRRLKLEKYVIHYQNVQISSLHATVNTFHI